MRWVSGIGQDAATAHTSLSFPLTEPPECGERLMRIAFIIPKFGIGGAERVGSLLCNAWVAAGHRVTAITFEAKGVKPAFALDPRVAVCQTDALNTSDKALLRMTMNVRRLSLLRDALKELRPEVIVAFTTEANVVALWAAVGLDIPVIISERNQPERPGLGRWREIARRLSYPFAAGIVVQTEAIADWARQRFSVPIEVLPNPIHPSTYWSRASRRLRTAIQIGRLRSTAREPSARLSKRKSGARHAPSG
jgi:hypothetical protein